jgi:hypothetical protein
LALSGLEVRWRITLMSARILAGVRIAQGSEPNPPASLTAIASSVPHAPPIGD